MPFYLLFSLLLKILDNHPHDPSWQSHLANLWRIYHCPRIHRIKRPFMYNHSRYSIWHSDLKTCWACTLAIWKRDPSYKTCYGMFINPYESVMATFGRNLDLFIAPRFWNYIVHYNYRHTLWFATF